MAVFTLDAEPISESGAFCEEVIEQISRLRAGDAHRRVVVLTPGSAASARVRARLCEDRILGASVVESQSLVPSLLPPETVFSDEPIRRKSFWLTFLTEQYPDNSEAWVEERADQLIDADLLEIAAESDRADLKAAREGTRGIVDVIAPTKAGIVVFGFDSEDTAIELPNPLDAILPALNRSGCDVVYAKARFVEGQESNRTLVAAPDRMSEVVAVADAIASNANDDVAVVVPTRGIYEEALRAHLERRDIDVWASRSQTIRDLPVGRWLVSFLQASADRFARPLMIDLFMQLAVAGVFEVDDVIDLDQMSRRKWVLDSTHWYKAQGWSNVDAHLRSFLRTILDAGAAQGTDDIEKLGDLLAGLSKLDAGKRLSKITLDEELSTNQQRLGAVLSTAIESAEKGVRFLRLPDAFGLVRSTVYVVGMDSTGTYRNSQSEFEIDEFKAKRRSWSWLLSTVPNLVVTVPSSDLATGDQLEPSAWVTEQIGDSTKSVLGRASDLRLASPANLTTSGHQAWLKYGPSRTLDELGEHRWSPSQFGTFQRCPLQWMLKSRFRLYGSDLPEKDAVFDPATRGTIVHEVLERHFTEGNNSFEELLQETIEKHIAENALHDGDPFIELGITDLANRLRKGHDAIEAELALDGSEQQEHEAKIESTIICGGETVWLSGKIDRQINGDKQTVLDYKSSKKATKPGDLASAGTTGENLQLWIYGLMMDPRPDELVLAFPLSNTPNKEVTRVTAGEAQYARVADGIGRLVSHAGKSALGIAADAGNVFSGACSSCEVKQACPSRHRNVEAHDPQTFF